MSLYIRTRKLMNNVKYVDLIPEPITSQSAFIWGSNELAIALKSTKNTFSSFGCQFNLFSLI